MRKLLLSLVLFAAAPTQSHADVDGLRVPDGFRIDVYVDDVPNARSMTLGDNGTVFVSTRRDGRVYAISDGGAAPIVRTIASDLDTPNGIAFHDGALYVAERTKISRYPGIENNLGSPPAPQVIYDQLPSEAHHGWRYIGFGPDNRLYVSIGVPCNVCEREGFANISRMNADGSGFEVFAQGVRNSVGFAWHPDTGELWFTDNGRDMLGDDTPACELNNASQAGMHFGFPYCHAGDVKDPDFGGARACSEFTAPAQKLGAHVAPLGLSFYTGDMFPPEYRGQIFIAEHGSWNRTEKVGYRLSLVRMVDGQAAGYEAFADGWLQGDEVTGRPTDVLMLPDGSLLVSDDKAGRIFRISYAEN